MVNEEKPWVWEGPPPSDLAIAPPIQPRAAAIYPPSPEYGPWAGDKFHGGFGPTQLFEVDYWTLRERSAQLFRENLYARGLIRRFITNEINTGLRVECVPEESILGFPEDSLSEWTETVENRHALYADNAHLCDYAERRTDGQLQREARMEALISGDVLVVLHLDERTALPRVQLINGSAVRTPMDPQGRNIKHGVELDVRRRHVAYWIQREDGGAERISAVGPKSGRRVAWLYYGCDKRMDDIRGEPLLSIILQSLKEIDRYRDSAQRKATINSILAMFIQKDENKMGTNPISGGAIRKQDVTVEHTEGPRKFGIAEQIPGLVIEELQQGEKPVPGSTAGTDVNFGAFEESIISAIAWINETPPEIVRLSFSSNYSASQAAINEYKMYLNVARSRVAEQYNNPIFREWFLSEVLTGRIQADGFLDAWRDPMKYDIYGAWLATDWTGAIKPSTDLVKQAKGYQILVSEGWITNDRTSRELTGTKYSKNIRRIKRENEMKVEAARVLLDLENEIGPERARALLRAVE